MNFFLSWKALYGQLAAQQPGISGSENIVCIITICCTNFCVIHILTQNNSCYDKNSVLSIADFLDKCFIVTVLNQKFYCNGHH
jgi:hypothetical protein